MITWVEAFTGYSCIFFIAHPSRWEDSIQYKFLILKTSRQFTGYAWLHYGVALGLVDWSFINQDLSVIFIHAHHLSKQTSLLFPAPVDLHPNFFHPSCRVNCQWH